MEFEQDNRLSALDLRNQKSSLYDNPQINIGHLGTRINGPREETPGKARERKARAIPEETFADDPQLAKLRRDRDFKAAVAGDPNFLGSWCAEKGKRIAKTDEVLRDEMMWAMLEDAIAERSDFPRTIEVIQDHAVRQHFRQTLEDLHNRTNGWNSRGFFTDKADEARRAYQDHLFLLQMKHLDKMEQDED